MINNIGLRSTAILAGLSLVLSVGNISSTAASSRLLAEIGVDDTGGDNHYLSARFGFDEGPSLNLTSSQSNSDDINGNEITSRSHGFGIESDPTAMLGIGIDFQNTDQAGAIDIDTTTLNLGINTADWYLHLSPGSRNISLTTQTMTPQKISIDSTDISVGASYYGWNPAYISLSAATYDYSRNLSGIGNFLNFFINRFGSTAIDQVFALESRHTKLEAGYYFDDMTVVTSHSRGVSAVDGSISIVNKLRLDYRIDTHWQLGLVGGHSSLDTSSADTLFGSISLAYSW